MIGGGDDGERFARPRYKIENCAVAESNKRGYMCPLSYPIPRPEKYWMGIGSRVCINFEGERRRARENGWSTPLLSPPPFVRLSTLTANWRPECYKRSLAIISSGVPRWISESSTNVHWPVWSFGYIHSADHPKRYAKPSRVTEIISWDLLALPIVWEWNVRGFSFRFDPNWYFGMWSIENVWKRLTVQKSTLYAS